MLLEALELVEVHEAHESEALAFTPQPSACGATPGAPYAPGEEGRGGGSTMDGEGVVSGFVNGRMAPTGRVVKRGCSSTCRSTGGHGACRGLSLGLKGEVADAA